MRFLITAGPTREYVDSVRYISNPSSGKFGYAIAAEAVRRGHAVELISGPVELAAPSGITLRSVVSADEMLQAAVAAFELCDVAIMAAAVCDFRPARRESLKVGKHERSKTLELIATQDICATLGAIKGNRIVIGFAMEDHDHRTHAEEKLRRKHCDAIILNALSTVGSDEAEIQILRADTGWHSAIRGTKSVLATYVIDLAETLSRRFVS